MKTEALVGAGRTQAPERGTPKRAQGKRTLEATASRRAFETRMALHGWSTGSELFAAWQAGVNWALRRKGKR